MRGQYIREHVKVEFECPKCGCHYYGSLMPRDESVPSRSQLQRHCNGGCGGGLLSSADDYKHFTVDGKKLSSQAEYEAAVYTDSYEDARTAPVVTPLKGPP